MRRSRLLIFVSACVLVCLAGCDGGPKEPLVLTLATDEWTPDRNHTAPVFIHVYEELQTTPDPDEPLTASLKTSNGHFINGQMTMEVEMVPRLGNSVGYWGGVKLTITEEVDTEVSVTFDGKRAELFIDF